MEIMSEKTSVSSALDEAQSIIETAKRRADQLLADAQERFKSAESQGYQAGLLRGEEKITKSAIQLIHESSEIPEILASEAARLAYAIVEKVLGKKLTEDPMLYFNLAKEALNELYRASSLPGQEVSIIIHSALDGLAQELKRELLKHYSHAKLLIIHDESMSLDGIVLKSPFGEVRVSLESLLLAVRKLTHN